MSCGIARQRRPPERTLAFAEQGADERRHEPRVRVRAVVRQATELRARSQVVPVVEHDRPRFEEPHHRVDVARHGRVRALHVVVRVGGSKLRGFVQRHAGRHVSAERIVRAGLVRHDVRHGNPAGAAPGRPRPRCPAVRSRPLRRPPRLVNPPDGFVDVVVSRSRYRVLMRRSIREGRPRRTSATPSFIVTAKGCAPPIPPQPARQRGPSPSANRRVLLFGQRPSVS